MLFPAVHLSLIPWLGDACDLVGDNGATVGTVSAAKEPFVKGMVTRLESCQGAFGELFSLDDTSKPPQALPVGFAVSPPFRSVDILRSYSTYYSDYEPATQPGGMDAGWWGMLDTRALPVGSRWKLHYGIEHCLIEHTANTDHVVCPDYVDFRFNMNNLNVYLDITIV